MRGLAQPSEGCPARHFTNIQPRLSAPEQRLLSDCAAVSPEERLPSPLKEKFRNQNPGKDGTSQKHQWVPHRLDLPVCLVTHSGFKGAQIPAKRRSSLLNLVDYSLRCLSHWIFPLMLSTVCCGTTSTFANLLRPAAYKPPPASPRTIPTSSAANQTGIARARAAIHVVTKHAAANSPATAATPRSSSAPPERLPISRISIRASRISPRTMRLTSSNTARTISLS